MEIDGRPTGQIESSRKLTESLPATHKIDRSSRKIFWPHRKWTKDNGNLPATWKFLEVDGWSQVCTKYQQKLMEGLPVIRKVDKGSSSQM